MYLNLGAKQPEPKITATIGQSSRQRPLLGPGIATAASRLNERDFSRIYGETLDKVVGEKPKGRPIGNPAELELQSWADVERKLNRLFPYFTYREDTEGRLVLLMPSPSAMAIAEYDSHPSHIRTEADELKDVPGPKRAVIGISTGWIPYCTDILTEKVPRRIVARSLLAIVRACDKEGAFTIAAAEKVFARRFRNVALRKVYMDIDPLAWSRQREESALVTTGAA